MNGFALTPVFEFVRRVCRATMLEQKPAEEERKDGVAREWELARLVAEHVRLLYRVAYGVLRHAEDAEDAVQDALLKLVRGESWRAMENERAFLARVVWRTALDRQSARMAVLDDERTVLLVEDERPSPERAAADGDARALLHELIDGLPEELRQTLVLSAIEELSSREIGEVMGVPEGTVRTRLMRARAVLKAKYDERCAGRQTTSRAGSPGMSFARGREEPAGRGGGR